MTYDTRSVIVGLQQKISATDKHIDDVQADTGKRLLEVKDEVMRILHTQREEIIRLEMELKSKSQNDKRKRIAALKRFRSE